jgi:hypothetical protein
MTKYFTLKKMAELKLSELTVADALEKFVGIEGGRLEGLEGGRATVTIFGKAEGHP